MNNNLFSNLNNSAKPLAERMRPKDFNTFVGQKHLLSENSLLMRAIKADKLGNSIFYGPTGVGKTTLANIIANLTTSNFRYLNAVSSGIQDAKKIIEEAKSNFELYGTKTYLFLDECHRWNKAQSDYVLSYMEQGTITFIGSTTENPYVSMTNAIVSRCRIFEFKKLTNDEILSFLKITLKDKENGLGNYNIKITENVLKHFVFIAAGDLRVALNGLELACLSTKPNKKNEIVINKKIAEESMQKKSLSLSVDMYYDMLSAFCKSVRGSDSNAALYWAERLIQAGCDPRIILRRLIAHSAEDVGMANPLAQVVATNALVAFEKLGMPEGKLNIYNAIIYVTESEKSNSVYMALNKVEETVAKHKDDNVPSYLKDQSYTPNKEKDNSYLYPFNFGGYVEQQYLPTSLKDEKFYIPQKNGYEASDKFREIRQKRKKK